MSGSPDLHILGRGMTGFTSTTKICNLHAARSTVTVQSPDSADTRQVRRVFCRTNDCSLALCLLIYSCVLAYVKNDRAFLGCQNWQDPVIWRNFCHLVTMCTSIVTVDTSKITKATSNLTVPFGSVKFDVKLRHYTTFYVNCTVIDTNKVKIDVIFRHFWRSMSSLT